MRLLKHSLRLIFTSFLFLFILFGSENVYSQYNRTESLPISNKPKELLVRCKVSYTISVPGTTRMVRLTVLIPESVPNIQNINRVDFSIKPVRYLFKNGYRYAEIMINDPKRVEKLEVNILAGLLRYDLQTAMENKEKNQSQQTGLNEFLREEKYIEKENSEIIAIADNITGTDEIEIIRNIYKYVLDNMEYVIQGKKDRGAIYALRYKKGDCSEYADLFVALCRAKKIPARVVNGISVQSDNKTAKHNWAEVYLKEYGWVPFDPSKGDIRYSVLKDKLFNTLEPTYIYFSHLRNDDVLQNYHYCAFTYYGDQISVSDSIEFEFLKDEN
jgi:transglutaminase-like putative cysteine protease